MTRGYLYRHEGARCPVGEVRREWKVADGVTLGLSCGRRRREGGDGGSLSRKFKDENVKVYSVVLNLGKNK